MKEQFLLLDSLKKSYPDSSAKTLKGWIKQKRVLVNDELAVKASQKITPSCNVTLCAKPKFLSADIKIIYEDNDIIVVDKPAGLLSVATEKEKERTVHDILKRHFFQKRVYPIHRLDRDTSGLIIFALNLKAKEGLKSQFKDRSLSRHYMAIVHGSPSPSEGFWESYLYEDPNLVMRETTKDRGKLALSFYQTVHASKDLSLLNIHLKTGRKNQIRVQSAAQNHPIVGDKKYGLSGDPFKRLGLHAYLVEFTHPTTAKRLCFKSLLPRELRNIIRVKVYIDEKTLSLQVG